MKTYIVLAASLMVFGSAGARDLPQTPTDVPPLVGIAEVIAPDRRSKVPKVSLILPKAQWEIVGKMVPMKQWPELKIEVKWETLTLQFDGPSELFPSRIVDLSGKELESEEWAERLKAKTPVLVSVSGKMPDPYYLQVVTPSTLIVILGPRDGSPRPALLPSEAKFEATSKPAEQDAAVE